MEWHTRTEGTCTGVVLSMSIQSGRTPQLSFTAFFFCSSLPPSWQIQIKVRDREREREWRNCTLPSALFKLPYFPTLLPFFSTSHWPFQMQNTWRVASFGLALRIGASCKRCSIGEKSVRARALDRWFNISERRAASRNPKLSVGSVSLYLSLRSGGTACSDALQPWPLPCHRHKGRS